MNSLPTSRIMADYEGRLCPLEQTLDPLPAMPNGGEIPGALRLAMFATISGLACPEIYDRGTYKLITKFLRSPELDFLDIFITDFAFSQFLHLREHYAELRNEANDEVLKNGLHGGASLCLSSVANMASRASLIS